MGGRVKLKKGEKRQRRLALADYIEGIEPKHFNMREWAKKFVDDSDLLTLNLVCPTDVNSCGTTCCVAGWHMIQKGFCLTFGGSVFTEPRGKYLGNAEELSAKDLGLTPKQRETLFHQPDWPTKFAEQIFGYTATPHQAAERIRYIANTGR